MRSIRGAALAAALALALLLPAVAAQGASAEETALDCAIRPVTSTNPLTADPDSWRVLNLIYDSATKADPATGLRVPYIAVGSANMAQDPESVSWKDCAVGEFGYCPEASWEDPSKPEAVIFYDFEGVRWHDGHQMDIRDIMFSLHANSYPPMEWLGNPLIDMAGREGTNYTQEQWIFVEKVWESGDGSRAALRFTLQERKFSVFERYLSAAILPYHIWGGTEANQETENSMIWCDPEYNISDEFSWKRYLALLWDNPDPVGSGSFVWAGSDGGVIKLTPWQCHFYRPGFKYYDYGVGIAGTPKISELRLHAYTSRDSALTDLETGNIDIVAWDLSVAEVSRFSDNPDIEYRVLRSVSEVSLAFNMRRKPFGYILEYDGSAALGTDYGKPLRKAVAHCLDTASFASLSSPFAQGPQSLAAFGSWDNSSVPTYSFDPQEAVNILRNAGYVLDDPAGQPGEGNWWSNPDGSPLGRGTGGAIELLTAQFGTDPLMYQVSAAAALQMRSVGIRATLTPLDAVTLRHRIEDRDFDVCVLRREFSDLGRARPETYYFGAFHSCFADEGPNVCGYDNSTFDLAVASGLDMTDPAAELKCVQDAMASVAYDVPETLLYREHNTEIFRAGSFAGLEDDGSGSLLSQLSLARVYGHEIPSIKAKIAGMPQTALSNATLGLTVRVSDAAGRSLQGVTLALNASSGSLLDLTGTTDANGEFSTNYTAPYVPLVETYSNSEAVTITVVSALLSGYRPAQPASFALTVFPARTRTMLVEANADPDTFASGSGSGSPGFTHLNIMVRDGANTPVNGVALNLRSQDPNVTLSAYEVRTDDGGSATVTVYAANITQATECTITIEAARGGFRNSTQNVTLTVLPYPAEAEEPGTALSETLAAPAAAALLALAAAAVGYRKWKRGRRK